MSKIRKKLGLLRLYIQGNYIIPLIYKFLFLRKFDYKYNLIKSYNGYKFLDRFKLKKDSIVIDFGANVGDFAGYVYDNFNSKIYCYEPNPMPFEILKKRFKFNKNIFTYMEGVSDDAGNKKLYLSKTNLGFNTVYLSTSSSLQLRKNLDQNNFLNIKIKKIDDILAEHNFIDLIKIDIEGSEYNILKSIISNKHKIKSVVCEFHYKSPELKNKMNSWKKYLKDENLYDKWFFEWNYE